MHHSRLDHIRKVYQASSRTVVENKTSGAGTPERFISKKSKTRL